MTPPAISQKEALFHSHQDKMSQCIKKVNIQNQNQFLDDPLLGKWPVTLPDPPEKNINCCQDRHPRVLKAPSKKSHHVGRNALFLDHQERKLNSKQKKKNLPLPSGPRSKGRWKPLWGTRQWRFYPPTLGKMLSWEVVPCKEQLQRRVFPPQPRTQVAHSGKRHRQAWDNSGRRHW